MKRIALSAIVFDAGTQIRAAINESIVAEYAEQMIEGVTFPPVVLFHDGNAYYMADGFHRGMAAKRNEFREIDADVRPGTKTDALWFALGANKANGQRLTPADKRHAILLAFQAWPERSGRQIAEQIGCSAMWVSKVKEEAGVNKFTPDAKVTGKDGKSYPASRPSAAKEPKVVPPKNSKVAVAQRRKDIRDMAARGFSTRQIASGLDITEKAVSEIAKKEGVTIHADRVIGKTKRHDANRIIQQMVMDAENLCAAVELIDFSAVDRGRLAEWLKSLNASRKVLSTFIRRLEQEYKKHVEAA